MTRTGSNVLVFTGAFVGVGLPLLLWWLLDSDSERYIETINGPFPFSHLGGGPFRMLVYVLAGILTVILLGAGFLVRWFNSRPRCQ